MRSMSEEIGARLVEVQKALGLSQREIASFLGLSLRGWQNLIYAKSSPSSETLIKLTEKGFSSDWLLTGSGSMSFSNELSETPQAPFETTSKVDQERPGQPVNPHEVYRATVTTSGVDPELLGRVTGMVATLYRHHGMKLSHADAAKIGAPYYDRLRAMAVTGDEDERLALLGVLRVWLEKELTTPASDFDNSKASA